MGHIGRALTVALIAWSTDLTSFRPLQLMTTERIAASANLTSSPRIIVDGTKQRLTEKEIGWCVRGQYGRVCRPPARKRLIPLVTWDAFSPSVQLGSFSSTMRLRWSISLWSLDHLKTFKRAYFRRKSLCYPFQQPSDSDSDRCIAYSSLRVSAHSHSQEIKFWFIAIVSPANISNGHWIRPQFISLEFVRKLL